MDALVEFANNNLLLVTGLVASGLAAAFYELRLKARNVASISVPLAVRMINQGGRVIDVRPADKFAAGHIVDARNIEREALLQSPDQIKGKNAVLVCDTGAESGECAARLRKEGLENIFSLRGGLDEWRKENLPLVGAD